MLGLFYRNAQGVITNAEYALTWQAFAQPHDQVGEVVSVLGAQPSAGTAGRLGADGRRQRRRLGAIRRGTPTYAPGRGDLPSGLAYGVNRRFPDRQRLAAPQATVGVNLDLEDVVILNGATDENMLGDTESTAPFALRRRD